MRFQWAVIEADLDPIVGAEQSGKRLVLIVSDEEFNQVVSNVTVLPLTSTERRLYPDEVLIEAGKAGQSKKSIVMAHQIRTISKQRLGKLLGYLDDPELRQQVQKALVEHLGIKYPDAG